MEWAAILTYWGLLLALTCVVSVKGGGPMLRTVLTLLGVGLIQLAVAQFVSPETDAHVWIMLAVDSTACAIITLRPAGQWQSLIGLSYILQIGTHIGRLVANNPDMYFYWTGLTVCAYLQLVLLGGWWISGRISHLGWRRSPDPVASQARHKGVE